MRKTTAKQFRKGSNTSFIRIFSAALMLMVLFTANNAQAANKAKNLPKRPYAESPIAKMTVEDGATMWKTTVKIYSHREYWWIKTAEAADPLSKRSCREDKSPGKKNSAILLKEIFMFPPGLKGENGLFNVQIVPGNDLGNVKNMKTCTYDANLVFTHGTKGHNVKATFKLEIQPGSKTTEPVVKAEPPKPVTPEPPRQAVKPEPPKPVVPEPPKQVVTPEPPKPVTPEPPRQAVTPEPSKTPVVSEPEKEPVKTEPVADTKPSVFQPEDLPEPEKVVVSEETKLAFNKPTEVSAPIKSSAAPTGAFEQGLSAYQAGKYKEAADLFAGIPVPTTKRRGDKKRDEYVNANFYRGLSLQKLGDLKGALEIFQTVQDYEKYFPILSMNMGICYLELRQYAKAHKSFKEVIRDQSRIPPDIFDDIMQNSRYFWAITWTRLFKVTENPDKKDYFRREASLKWEEYKSWYGDDIKYKSSNEKVDMYKQSLTEN